MTKLRARDIFYFRRRFHNHLFAMVSAFYAQEAEAGRTSIDDIAGKLDVQRTTVMRWLRHPSGMTMETVSDLLFAMDAEIEPSTITVTRTNPEPVGGPRLSTHVAPSVIGLGRGNELEAGDG